MNAKSNLSIQSTLFLIIGLLSFLICIQAGFNVYRSWQNLDRAEELGEAAPVINLMFSLEKGLSQERGATMGALYVPRADSENLYAELKAIRDMNDRHLKKSLALLRSRNNTMEDMIRNIEKEYEALRETRKIFDDIAIHRNANNAKLSQRVYNETTKLIIDIHDLIEKFSSPYLANNPAASRQMRFSHVIWNITEYSGREYSILSKVIAENRYPTEAEQRDMLVWQGRIEYGWDLANSVVENSSWGGEILPYLKEAKTHYFLTFEQIKAIFDGPKQDSKKSKTYPISVDIWLELATQAIESLYTVNDEVLKTNKVFVSTLKSDAEKSIMISVIIFSCALLLGFHSWRVIMLRVIRPVNIMIEALIKATRGESYEMPEIDTGHDEIGVLTSVLRVFHENAVQLEEERDRAEAANIAKSEFLANMSHEIRTPMNVVLGLSNILAKTSPLTDKQKEFIKTLQLSAESLLSIINDIMDFSKLETRNFELEKIPFSLENIITEIITIISVKTTEKKISLDVDLSALAGKEYVGDPTRIRQALMNLCSNAVKFTVKGSISITARASQNRDTGLEDIYITVKDTGIGIPPNKLDIIFDKFTQADSSISRKFGGTGLGLAIAKTFIEMMSGHIKVESILNEGTTFNVYFPLAPSAVSVASTATAQGDSPVTANKQKILLVEDYYPNALVAGTLLEDFGFSYDLAEDGYKALELAKENNYHAILMDIQMPELDGYQTTAAIRDFELRNRRKNSYIIGVTAHALPEDREKCLKAGMNDYLSKPFTSDQLAEKLSLVQ